MSDPPAVEISHLAHLYGEHQAIRELSFSVNPGEIFALLGPNGSGKTTLFRVLSTLIPIQQGSARILGHDLRSEPQAVRRQLGVVFQAPSLDKKLTAAENLVHFGRLYGLAGRELKSRADEMLARLGLTDRKRELVEKLSGGLRRRVELAKGMLHRPRLLLLDEPSTGLDPAARSDLWQYFNQVRQEDGVTIVLTTHLLEEAERADRIAVMHRGELVALDTPAALRAAVGGDAITIRADDSESLAVEIADRLQLKPTVVDGFVRLELPAGHEWIPRLIEAFPDRIESITLGKPTLEDVFIHVTGHRFWNEDMQNRIDGSSPQSAQRTRRR
ncbi:MAG TPA: ATP-binding cassette domain-containing protein [Lacipirellulaceae bacterium]|jgi:ABC-2 type transport system ATP-binding protein|nr:ATP-binding cassette domain-containing protein [Lacipirellulaceae bacterium]